MWSIPIIASVLYLLGGQANKWFRWGMGIPIFFIAIFTGHAWYSIFVVFTYLIATNAFSYGENMWTTKIFGAWISMITSGIAFGLASTPILGWTWGIVQAIIGGVSFGVIKYYDDKGVIHNPIVELGRGFTGTFLFFCF